MHEIPVATLAASINKPCLLQLSDKLSYFRGQSCSSMWDILLHCGTEGYHMGGLLLFQSRDQRNLILLIAIYFSGAAFEPLNRSFSDTQFSEADPLIIVHI